MWSSYARDLQYNATPEGLDDYILNNLISIEKISKYLSEADLVHPGWPLCLFYGKHCLWMAPFVSGIGCCRPRPWVAQHGYCLVQTREQRFLICDWQLQSQLVQGGLLACPWQASSCMAGVVCEWRIITANSTWHPASSYGLPWHRSFRNSGPPWSYLLPPNNGDVPSIAFCYFPDLSGRNIVSLASSRLPTGRGHLGCNL